MLMFADEIKCSIEGTSILFTFLMKSKKLQNMMKMKNGEIHNLKFKIFLEIVSRYILQHIYEVGI